MQKTYGDNNEVKPTPRVREILAKTVGTDLDEHFKDKDDREDFVKNGESGFEKGAFRQFDVDVFRSLPHHSTPRNLSY